MAARWTTAALALAAVVALALGACAPDLPGVWDCADDQQCFEGERCVQNVCVSGAAEAGQGEEAGEGEEADAGPDAAPSN